MYIGELHNLELVVGVEFQLWGLRRGGCHAPQSDEYDAKNSIEKSHIVMLLFVSYSTKVQILRKITIVILEIVVISNKSLSLLKNKTNQYL